MEIRCMTGEDVSQIALMEQEYFSQPWSEQAFLDVMNKNEYLYMVAIEGAEVIGYCGMYRVLEEGNITQIAVRSDKRGRGVARKLLQEFMQEGKKRGVETYTLEVRISNTNAQRLYETCGFVTECIRKDFYALPKEDAFIMWKR